MGRCVPTGIITFAAIRGARATLSSRSPGRTHPPSAATTRRPQRRPLMTTTAACVGSLSTTVGVGAAPSAIHPMRAASPKLLALGGRAGAAAEAGVAAVALTDLRHCRRRQGLDPDPSLTTPAWVPPFRGPPCSSPLARGMHRPWMASSLFLPTWSCPPRPLSPTCRGGRALQFKQHGRPSVSRLSAPLLHGRPTSRATSWRGSALRGQSSSSLATGSSAPQRQRQGSCPWLTTSARAWTSLARATSPPCVLVRPLALLSVRRRA